MEFCSFSRPIMRKRYSAGLELVSFVASTAVRRPVRLSSCFFRCVKACREVLHAYSSIVLTHSHSPLKFSFHSETLLSAPLTASTFPLKLQLTRQTVASKFNTLHDHCPWLELSLVQMRTVLSCDADAM